MLWLVRVSGYFFHPPDEEGGNVLIELAVE